MRSSPSTAAKSCRNRMCRQGGKYAAWVDLFHGDRKIGASRKLWGKEEAFKLGSRKQLFHARNFCGGGVQRGLPPRLDIRQPPLGVLWLLSVATESNNFASAEATGAAGKIMPAFQINHDYHGKTPRLLGDRSASLTFPSPSPDIPPASSRCTS